MKNSALASLEPFIGEWEYTMYNAWFLESMGTKAVFLREDKDMHQRLTLEITGSGLHSIAEASDDEGKTWRKDLEMAYCRIN